MPRKCLLCRINLLTAHGDAALVSSAMTEPKKARRVVTTKKNILDVKLDQ